MDLAMIEKSAKGNDLTRGERLQIMLDAEELQALEDFRFSNRMPSRAAAVRELLRRGLAAEGSLRIRHSTGANAFRPQGSASEAE